VDSTYCLRHPIKQRCTTLLGQGPQRTIFSALEGRRQNYKLNVHVSSAEYRICFILEAFYSFWFDGVAIRAVSDCSKLQNC